MTEQEWLSADWVEPLLKWLQRSNRHRPTVRKLQLIANAFADRIADRFTDPTSLAVRRLMDRLADDELTQEEMWTQWRPWWSQLETIDLTHMPVLTWAVGVSVRDPSPAFSPEVHVRDTAACVAELAGETEPANQARLLRDIFGNPFRPVVFDPAWRTDTAVSLAKGMYGSRDFGAMPILADVLQDAGCDNDDVPNHCRDTKQVHVRGCWVVDLVLGKS